MEVLMSDRSLLIEHTADFVSAYVANNTVALSDVQQLVQRVYDALAGLSEPQAEPEPEGKTPIVSVRASVKPDYIVCMECGRKQKTLKRHLMTAHGLPSSYPSVAPIYSKQRGELARQIGLGRKREPQQEPEAQPRRRGRKPAN